jgi:hypothetical protein
MESKNCRRCSKLVEEVKNCGEANCPYYVPGGNFGPLIRRDLKIYLASEYFVDNLCNKCSEKFEDVLAAYYNCRTIGRTPEEFNNEVIEVEASGEHQGKYSFDAKSKKIKI